MKIVTIDPFSAPDAKFISQLETLLPFIDVELFSIDVKDSVVVVVTDVKDSIVVVITDRKDCEVCNSH